MKLIQYVSFYDHEINKKEKRFYSPACQSLTTYIAEVIAENGFDVEIISPSCTTAIKRMFKGKEYNINNKIKVCLPPTIGYYGFISKIVRLIWQKIVLYIFLLKKIKRDSLILVYHSVSLSLPIRIIKMLKRCKIILQVEEIYADVEGNKEYDRKERKLFECADAYLFPTIELNDAINMNEKPYVLIHGIYKSESRRKDISKDEKIHCIYAGTFDKTKGGVYAAIKCAQYLDENYAMHIIGFGTEKEIKSVIHLITEVQKKTKCSIIYDGLKQGEDFIRYLQSCDIGLSTQNPAGLYNKTSFPSKVLTYMANNLKVVSYKLEVLQNSSINKYIYYYEDYDAKTIARAIKKAANDQTVCYASIIDKLDVKFSKEIKELFEEFE